MHAETLKTLEHQHDFAVIHEHGEKRAIQVLVLTLVTMVIEIVAGLLYGSMALLADGWHMGTHGAAFLITIFAYRYTRKHAHDPSYAFGTGKVSVLGGFASAIALTVVALMMCIESIQRFFQPQPIHFDEAIAVAVIGLIVNISCALLLQGHHAHAHEHNHRGKRDHNLKAAYLHVMADAFTSVLAITALLAGKYFGWSHLDPFMGIVGAAIITRWGYSLITETSPILLDGSIEREYVAEIRKVIEAEADNRISDIHVWKVGPEDYAAIISIVTHHPRDASYYKKLLSEFTSLSHLTVEINTCDGESCETLSA